MENTEGEEEPATELDGAQASCSSTNVAEPLITPVTKNRKRSPAKMQPPAPPRASKYSKKSQTRFEKSVSQLQKIAELSTADSEDQHDKFGKFVAAQLRDMPLRSVIILQEKIQGLITTERLRLLDTIASPRTTSSLSSMPWSSPSVSDASNQDHVEDEEDLNTTNTSADLLSNFLTQL